MNKPYLDKEFAELAKKAGLINNVLEYHTKDGTRFFIDCMLQEYSLMLREKIIKEINNGQNMQ